MWWMKLGRSRAWLPVQHGVLWYHSIRHARSPCRDNIKVDHESQSASARWGQPPTGVVPMLSPLERERTLAVLWVDAVRQHAGD